MDRDTLFIFGFSCVGFYGIDRGFLLRDEIHVLVMLLFPGLMLLLLLRAELFLLGRGLPSGPLEWSFFLGGDGCLLGGGKAGGEHKGGCE